MSQSRFGDLVPASGHELVQRRGSSKQSNCSSIRSSDYLGASGSYLDSSEAAEEGVVAVVDANISGIIPGLAFLVFWTASASAALFAFLWVYAYEEVPRVEASARAVAVNGARLQAGEVLGPAVAVAAAVQAAYRAEALRSLSGYGNLTRTLQPHFRAWPSLLEIELVAGPDAVSIDREPLGTGGVLLSRGRSGAVEIRTDRGDCAALGTPMGCAKEPLRTEDTKWYNRSFFVATRFETIPETSWHGPMFVADTPHEDDCEAFCWRTAYAYISRVAAGPGRRLLQELDEAPGVIGPPSLGGGGDDVPIDGEFYTTTTTQTTTTTPPPPDPVVLVRAAVDVGALRTVVREAEASSRGEVVVCTEAGQVVARADMALAFRVDAETGVVRPAYLWELDRPWLDTSPEGVEQLRNFVRKGREGATFLHGQSRVSAHRLFGLANDTRSLDDSLRIVVAIHEQSFLDGVLGPLVMPSLVTSVLPLSTVTLLAVWALYLRLCARSSSAQVIGPLTRLS